MIVIQFSSISLELSDAMAKKKHLNYHNISSQLTHNFVYFHLISVKHLAQPSCAFVSI